MQVEEHEDTLEWLLSKSPSLWHTAKDLSRATGLTPREIRVLANERGYASGNDGYAKLNRLSPDEQEHAFNRIRSQAMAMLIRCKRMRQLIEQNTGRQLELPIGW